MIQRRTRSTQQRTATQAVSAAGAFATGTTTVTMGMRRLGSSVAAMLLNTLAKYMAPDQDKPGAVEREIARDRERGPALPPRRLRRRMRFSEERIGSTRVFRLAPSIARTGLRLLYLHGGAYILEVQPIQWSLVAGLLKRLPAELVAPVYPLAPEHGWQDGLDAVERVFSAMASDIGAANIAIVGDSAGGGLALALAQRLRDAGAPLPAALVLVSPWLDVGVVGNDQPALQERDPALSIGFLRQAGRLWAQGLPVDDARVSPLFGDQSGLPPTIVFSGGRDILASDAFRLAAKTPQLVHRHYPEMMHVWPAVPVPEGKRALDEAAAFIRQHLPER